MSHLGDVQRLLEQLSDLTRTNDKMAFLKQHEDAPHFAEVIWYALNPYRKYYLSKVPSSTQARPAEGTKSWDELEYILTRLATRTLSGKAAMTAVEKFSAKLAPAEYKVFHKILNKDLRCGVGAVLVNKVWPNYIPTFGVMLCTPLEATHIKKLKKHRCYHQPKKNGDRCVVLCRVGAEPEVLSRKGFPLLNYGQIAAALQAVVEETRVNMVWDGEVIRGGSFFATRNTKKLEGNEVTDGVFHCFDAVTLEQWEKGQTDIFSVRLKMLRGISKLDIWSQQCHILARVPTFALKEEDQTMEALDGLRDAYVEQGQEGLIIRVDEPYNFLTRSSCYKHKKMDTMDCTVLEVLPGEEGKKHEHHAGALLVELDNGEQCKAGLRASDKRRDELWETRGELVGMTVEIAYQDKTVNKSGVYKLQFPVWTGIIREDKS